MPKTSQRVNDAPKEQPKWLPWLMLGLAWLVYAYFGLVTSSLPPLLTRIKTDLGISHSQAGLILGAWPLIYMGLAYPAGLLNDRFGLKRMLLIAVAIISLSAFLRSTATSFATLFLAVALFGAGGPIVSGGLSKLVAQWFTGPARTRAAGIYVTGVGAGSAIALAGTNSLLLPLLDSWRAVFLVYGGVGVIVFACWFMLGRDGPSAETSSRNAPAIPAWAVLKMQAVWLVVIVGMAGFTLGHGFRNWLPAILEDKGFTSTEAGYLTTIPALVSIAGSLAISYVAAHFGKKRPLILGILTVEATTLTLIAIFSGFSLIPILLVQGFAAGAMMPLLLNSLMDLPEVGPRAMGTAAGLYFTVGEVGGVGGPSLVGVLKDITDSFTPACCSSPSSP
jgi:cyanate permease